MVLCFPADGLLGIVLLLLSLRLAHNSLMHKLERRKKKTPSAETLPKLVRNGRPGGLERTTSSSSSNSDASSSDEEKYDLFVLTQEEDDDEALDLGENEVVDKVYTIGCFDLFHHGHQKLLRRMRRLGKKVGSFTSSTPLQQSLPLENLVFESFQPSILECSWLKL